LDDELPAVAVGLQAQTSNVAAAMATDFTAVSLPGISFVGLEADGEPWHVETYRLRTRRPISRSMG
jgi:hypothetical protein